MTPSPLSDEQLEDFLERPFPQMDHYRMAKAIVAELKRLRSQGEWRPIADAPKQHAIMLFAVTDLSAEGLVRNWKMATGHKAHDGVWVWEGRRLKPYEIQPTHWCYHPQPPPLPPLQGANNEQDRPG